jgi:hypothetical protein
VFQRTVKSFFVKSATTAGKSSVAAAKGGAAESQLSQAAAGKRGAGSA